MHKSDYCMYFRPILKVLRRGVSCIYNQQGVSGMISGKNITVKQILSKKGVRSTSPNLPMMHVFICMYIYTYVYAYICMYIKWQHYFT